MDIYVLDNQLRRIEVFDYYKSFIWTERFSSVGEFELVIQVEPRALAYFVSGARLSIRDSLRVMEVETVEEKDSDEGRFLTVSGRSLEKILQDRVAKYSMTNLETDPNWKANGKPAEIVRYIFNRICIEGALDTMDIIPFIQPGTLSLPSTLPEPSDDILLEIEPADLYSVFKQICDPYNLGFRILRNFDFSQLYFEVYAGNNLTTGQTTLDPVVFSPSLDNLSNVTELTSTALYKNVAYVFAKNGFEVVYAADANPNTAGFERRVLVVNAGDLDTPAGPQLTSLLVQKGVEELSKNRQVYAFDGEIPQRSIYKYGYDYQLGDLVEMQNSRGYSNWMRVTEQIFVSDAEGDRNYPTLELDLVIIPGTWAAWDSNEDWDDAEGTWDEQP